MKIGPDPSYTISDVRKYAGTIWLAIIAKGGSKDDDHIVEQITHALYRLTSVIAQHHRVEPIVVASLAADIVLSDDERVRLFVTCRLAMSAGLIPCMPDGSTEDCAE
jgi:hypothetical protein